MPSSKFSTDQNLSFLKKQTWLTFCPLILRGEAYWEPKCNFQCVLPGVHFLQHCRIFILLLISLHVITGIFLLYWFYQFYMKKKNNKKTVKRIHTILCNECLQYLFFFFLFTDFQLDNLSIQEVQAFHHEKMLKNRAMDSGSFPCFFICHFRGAEPCVVIGRWKILADNLLILYYIWNSMFSLTFPLVFRFVSRF